MDFIRYFIKYSTTSTVYAEQSISNPDNSRAMYYIACILQAELFDDLNNLQSGVELLNPELNIYTSLPAHLGGIQTRIPDDVMERETAEDFELRVQLEAGTVPTVDTILRFMTWVQQSTSYSVHCNILGFIYLKRMRAARVILTMNNWRGMWLGSIILAQKVWDDVALRTSSFASVLPGVTKTQLKALELKVFTLLNFSTHVKPSLYARAYYDIRTIFKTILTEYEGGVAWRRPLSVKRAKALFGGADVSETNPGTDSPRRDLKPLLLPALKGAASRDSVTSGEDCYSQAGMKKGAYVDNSCSDCSLTASHSHSHEFEPSGHSGNASHNTSSVKLPTLMLSGAPSMVSTPKPYDPESYASDIASSFKSTSTGTSYTLPTMSTDKRHRRHKGKLTPLTYEDFTYQKKSPLYVIS